MKKSRIFGPLIIFSSIAVGILLGSLLNFSSPSLVLEKNSYKNKLNKLIDFIENEYVDSINTDSIVDLTVNNILEKLDPHSVYIPAEEFTASAESMKGDFVGIGINFYMYKDTVAVIKTIEDGPSAKAGIKAGDRILFADKDQLFGKKLPTDSLFSKLKGVEGSKVLLKIFRKSENKTFTLDLTRGTVPIKSVDVAEMIDDKTGYIKINRFAETTATEFKTALQELLDSNMENLVIDLRDNGGGYLEKANEIADELLKSGELIVFTKNKKQRTDKTIATKGGIFETGKLYVLINENSASASEIIAGAIQDNDRGLIVGRRSFGKGLVQREMNFQDGSAVRLTVARYYTPSGRSIQKPYVNGNEEYYGEFEHRFESGELYERDSIKIADTLKFRTKNGRVVYGGGGIVPDIFVPIEKEHGLEGLGYLMQSGIMGHFAFEQLDKYRSEFKGMSFEQFSEAMNKTDKYYKAFETYLASSGFGMNLKKNKDFVKSFIAAEFARQLFSEERYYEIIIKNDAMIKAVLLDLEKN
ncbi:MAG: S41 family peptidase [Flavobacterium sp.]